MGKEGDVDDARSRTRSLLRFRNFDGQELRLDDARADRTGRMPRLRSSRFAYGANSVSGGGVEPVRVLQPMAVFLCRGASHD